MLQTTTRFLRSRLQNYCMMSTLSTRPSRKCKAVSNLSPVQSKKQKLSTKTAAKKQPLEQGEAQASKSVKKGGPKKTPESSKNQSTTTPISDKTSTTEKASQKKAKNTAVDSVVDATTEEDNAAVLAAKKAKAAEIRLAKQAERPIFEQTSSTVRKYQAGSEQAFVALAWNLAGLRAVLRTPERIENFQRLIKVEKPDYLLIQEHKLQGKDVEELKTALEPYIPGYESHWTSSTGKKGYSGVAVFLKHPVLNMPSETQSTNVQDGESTESTKPSKKKKKGKQSSLKDMFGAKKEVEQTGETELSAVPPAKVLDSQAYRAINITMPQIEGASDEGRVITVEYPHFYLIGAYVPNSGQNLARLDYRIDGWNKKLNAYMQDLEKTKPVILGGDLNVAHTDHDVYNPEAKHIVKSAGTTPQERSAFGELLTEGNMVDTFRHYHPDARGAFSYWSLRVNNRPVNRGMRLDYFVASRCLVAGDAAHVGATDQSNEGQEGRVKSTEGASTKPVSTAQHDSGGAQIIDAWISPEYNASDHCPVGIAIALDNMRGTAS